MSPIIEQLAKEITFAQLEELIAHKLVNQSMDWFNDNDMKYDTSMVETNSIQDVEHMYLDGNISNHIKHICAVKGIK